MNNEFELDDTFESCIPDFNSMDYLMEAMALDYVDEGYVGKNKITAKIDGLFKEIKRKYPLDGFMDTVTKDINGSSEMRQICKEFENLTGFKTVKIIVKNEPVPNAYTAPGSILSRSLSMRNGMPTAPTMHGQLPYDEKHTYFCYMCISTGMIKMLEPAEITATLLHEIGHNFDMTLSALIFDFLFYVVTAPSGVLSVLLRIYNAEYVYAIDALWKILDYTIIFPLLKGALMQGNQYLAMLAGPLGAVSLAANVLVSSVQNPLNAIVGAARFQSEAFADNYVTAMGYGPELISMMDKVDKLTTVTDKGTAIEVWTGSSSAAMSVLCMFFDPHPENQTRVRMVLDDMKEVMNDPDLPPNMKSMVKMDYERTKEAYKDFLKADKDERNAKMTRLARGLKEEYFGGKMDVRALLYRLVSPVKATHQPKKYKYNGKMHKGK